MTLHNLNNIRKALNLLYDEIYERNGFEKYDLSKEGLGNEFHGFKKNELIFSYFLDPKVGYDLGVFVSGEPYHKRLSMVNFSNPIYPVFSKAESDYMGSVRTKLLDFEQFSVEYYFCLLKTNLEFLQEYYPEMIDNGQMPDFD